MNRRIAAYGAGSIMIGFVLSFMGANPRASGEVGAAQGGPEDKPVEQTRKNIQVLKGLPEGQLSNLMNYVSVSIGVQCIYCHVTQGKDANGHNIWVYESDEKPQKVIARRMMLMTMQLNRTNLADFRGQRISCYTCHRGSTDPARLVPLPLTYSGHDPALAPPAEIPRRTTQPTPEEILAKYVAAVGGREAIARVRTLVMRGTREASQGRLWPVEVSLVAPDKLLTVINVPAQGRNPAVELRQAYLGGTGWVQNHLGTRHVTPAELAYLRSAALLLSPIKLAEPPPRLAFGGVERIGGRDAYVLVSNPAADTTVRYFFDRETGLLVRQVTSRETVLNPIPEQVDYEDYRDVGGLKLPFTIRGSYIDTYDNSTRKFTEIKINVPVDETIFQMPVAPKR